MNNIIAVKMKLNMFILQLKMRIWTCFRIKKSRWNVLLIMAIWENSLKRSSCCKTHLNVAFVTMLKKTA